MKHICSLADDTLANGLSVRPCLHQEEKLFFFNPGQSFFWAFPEPKTVEALIRFAAKRGLGEEQLLYGLVTLRAEIARTKIVKWDKAVSNANHDNRFVTLRDWLTEQGNKDN